MKNSFEGFLIPNHTEYLRVSKNLIILETSPGAQKFAESPCHAIPGKDIRDSFPELIGYENCLWEIFEKNQERLELRGIARNQDVVAPLYIDLFVNIFEKEYVILLEDATERMVFEQKILQQTHEDTFLINYLLNALASAFTYIDSLITSINDVFLVTNAVGQIVTVNQAALQIFEYSKEDLILQYISTVIGKPDFSEPPQKTSCISKNSFKNCELVCYSKTGKNVTISFSKLPTKIEGIEHFVYIGRDITERKYLEKALYEEKELAQVTLQSIGDAVITTDAIGQIKYMNPMAEQMTRWVLADARGKAVTEIMRIIHETTRETVENPVEKVLGLGSTVNLTRDTILITRDGGEVPIDKSAAPIRDRDGQIIGAVIVFQDVSQTRSMAHQLSWQATHDPLTGLFNRREFERRLDLALTISKTQNQQNALCYLDLDRFKIVNDTCGHLAGDELLRQVTALFQNQIRASDTIARLGGDEFVILLECCPLEPALRIANTILQRVQEFRFLWQDKAFNIGVSIGLVPIDADTQNMGIVMSTADTACYLAKNNGRNRVHIYHANDREVEKAKGEMQWGSRIAQALEENRFCLYYQKIVPTTPHESRQEHREVLLRLIDEEGSIVSPMTFIPAAERYNLMPLIDRWVIRNLFTYLEQHQRQQLDEYVTLGIHHSSLYAINLSGASINDDQFMDFVREQLALHQIPPQILCFEITETVAIANLTKAASFIRALRELGCRFALDDFGSGMSSFGYLKNLPIDYLKIDGSFVRHIVEEPIDMAMVEAINQIGHVMGIQTIAEFVENEKILQKLQAIGVDYAQGYGIAKPHPF